MADEPDDDQLFDRLAKSLEALREDAELARSGGTEGISASFARIESELRNLATDVSALRQRFEQQHAATTRLEARTTKSEADLQALRQTVEGLSRQVREQAEALAEPPPRRSMRAAAAVGLALIILALAGGAAAWIASGSHPAVDALARRFVDRVSLLTGINLIGRDEPTRAARQMAEATSSPELVTAAPATGAAQPPASATPPSEALAKAEPPPASPPEATVTQAQTPPAAQSPAAETPAATSPAAQPPAPAPAPAQTPISAASPPAPASAATPPVPAPAAAPATSPLPQPAMPAPAATALAQPPLTPQPVHQLVLRATADSWVEVRHKGGRVLLNRVMKAGDTWAVPAEPDLVLNSGNAGALVLEVDGTPTHMPGAKAGVVRDVPLAAPVP